MVVTSAKCGDVYWGQLLLRTVDSLEGGVAVVFIATVTCCLWLLRRAAVVWGSDAAARAALCVFVFV